LQPLFFIPRFASMKQIILGDTHGRFIWKEIIKQDYDRVVFIGDYLDTHEAYTGLDQLHNLSEICEFKKSTDKEVILLIGNHDYHYFPEIGYTGCSGYQMRMKVAFEDAMNRYRDLFQMCFVDESGYIYSHAGFTKSFVQRKIGSFSQENVNMVWKHKPKSFDFFMGDYSGYGEHIEQSCIWVRPQSLYRDSIPGIQIVGHTYQDKINPRKSERQGYYLIDTLGTSKEYLVITDGQVEIKKA
jgi:hypothetical protein